MSNWKRINVPESFCNYIDRIRGNEPRHVCIKRRFDSKTEMLKKIQYLREMTFMRRGDEVRVNKIWNEVEEEIKKLSL